MNPPQPLGPHTPTIIIYPPDGPWVVPWGNGADSTPPVKRGYPFPCCGEKAPTKDEAKFVYDDTELCRECAQAWSRPVWMRPDAYRRLQMGKTQPAVVVQELFGSAV